MQYGGRAWVVRGVSEEADTQAGLLVTFCGKRARPWTFMLNLQPLADDYFLAQPDLSGHSNKESHTQHQAKKQNGFQETNWSNFFA